jgi:hypothetical protein
MEGAARTSGALEEFFEVGGKQYTLKDPGYLAFMEQAEAFIIARRPNPLVQAAEAMSELDRTLAPSVQVEQQEAIRLIAESAMMNRNRAGPREVQSFLDTSLGLAFMLWKFCPQLESLAEAQSLFKAMAEEKGQETANAELSARIGTVSGVVEVKNSSGPDPKGPGESEGVRGGRSKKLIWPGPEGPGGIGGEPKLELAGWPEVYRFLAAEYPGLTREEIRRLPQLMLCTLLGAITPDHKITRLPGKDARRLTRTEHEREVLERVHGRKLPPGF